MLEGDWLFGSHSGGSALELSSTISKTCSLYRFWSKSNPSLYSDDNGIAITTSNCGGVLLDESWVLRYDGATGDWEVKGTPGCTKQ